MEIDKFETLVNCLIDNLKIKRTIVDNFIKHSKKIKNWSEKAYSGNVPNFEICKLCPLDRLTVLVYKTKEIIQKYRNLKVPDIVITGTLKDINLRQNLYFIKYGKAGLSQDDVIWLRHLNNTEILKLGALQFQKFKMIYLDKEEIGEDFMPVSEKQKKKLPTGTPVINVHVQKGADLSENTVTKSFDMALDLFKTVYPEINFKAFLCCSWLLYPKLNMLLNSKSNILAFAKNFEIIAQTNDKNQALYNIYNTKSKNKKLYSLETSLQQNAINNLKNLGEAMGIKYLN